MALEALYRETNNFLHSYFSELSVVVDCNHKFIEKNSLHKPKKNFSKIKPILDIMIKELKMYDEALMHATFMKMYSDVSMLLELLKRWDEKLASCENLFLTEFTKSVPILKEYRKKIREAKIEHDNSKFINYKKEYERILEIYKKHFQIQFIKDRKYLLDEMRNIIDIKVYYIDKLFWKYVKNNVRISNFFLKRSSDGVYNTASYLRYYIESVKDEYVTQVYAKECLEFLTSKDNE